MTGDYEAADRIELNLPETGICTTNFILDTESNEGCYGGPAKNNNNACCIVDEELKTAAGESGCGCNTEHEEFQLETSCC